MSSTAYTAITTRSALLSTLYVRTGTSSCYTSSPGQLNTRLVVRTGTSSCSGVGNALPGHLLCSWLTATIHDQKRYPLECVVVKLNKPGAKNMRWQSCTAIYVPGHISCTRYCCREVHVEKSTSNHPAPPVCACHHHQIRSVRFWHLQGLKTERQISNAVPVVVAPSTP